MTAVDGTGAAGTSAAEALAERLFAATLGASELQAVYLGDRLGLVPRAEPITARSRRRSWRTGQGPSKDMRGSGSSSRPSPVMWTSIRMPIAGTACRRPTPMFWSTTRTFFSWRRWRGCSSATTSSMPRLLDAYRHGGGVTWESMGPDAREGQALLNRPMVSPSALSAVSAGSHRPARHTFGRRAGR